MGKHWLKKALLGELTPEEYLQLVSSYDVVGDIAIIRIREKLEEKAELIAKAIMDANKHIKTVLRQTSSVSGDFRLRGLEWISGEKKTSTVHVESGCRFHIDLAASYFSPRLSYERMRIAQLVQPDETVVNMFAGVGCFSIITARHSKAGRIYSIDINPDAIRLMEKNINLNKVEKRIVPIEGDAQVVIEKELMGKADRVLMPLPEKAYEYLNSAIEALKPSGGWVHYYDSTHAYQRGDAPPQVIAKVSERLENLKVDFKIPNSRTVRTVGPNWYQIVLDILVRGKYLNKPVVKAKNISDRTTKGSDEISKKSEKD